MSHAATPGPTRRSARIGSTARSVASQSAISVSVTAKDTPKDTPSRTRALPKVKSRQSTAYGASGRIGVAQELSVPQTGFSEAFETQRGAAIARESEERSIRNGSAAGRDTPSQQDYESEDPPSEESEQDEEEISAETSKSFGMGHEAGMLRPPTPNRRTPVRPGPSTTPRTRTSGAVHPVNAVLAEKPLRPAVRDPVVNGGTPRLHISGPAKEPLTDPRLPPIRPTTTFTPRIPTDQLSRGVTASSAYRSSHLRPAQTQNGGTVLPRPSTQQIDTESEPETKAVSLRYFGFAVLILLLALAAALVATGEPANAYATRLEDGWKYFKNKFPLRFPLNSPLNTTPFDRSNLGARVDDVELRLKDIQGFVHSLGDEMPEWVVVSRSPSGTMSVTKEFWSALISRIRKEGPSIEWDTFVQHNQEKLKSALGTEGAVLREDFLRTIDTNFKDISEDFDRKLEHHTQSLLKEVEKAASKEAKKVSVEYARYRSMALTNLIANVELNYGTINYFSTGLGADIITRITSPTLSRTPAPFMRLMQRLVSAKNNPPSSALERWDEPGDCWCAAPDDKKTGKAQLAIKLGEPILPTQLTIEHLPRSSAPNEDIRSAPQNVEFWVQSSEPALVRFAYDGERCEPGPDGWQCLGKVRYDRNGANHVQTFLLDGEAQTPVDRVMLRVTSNWGSDHTCIYRVRLHGKGLRAVPEGGE